MKQQNFPALRVGLMAGAVLALAAPVAQAQSSVTLYGRVDLGVQHSSKTRSTAPGALPTTNAGNLTELYNGGIRPSIWGFRGSEDLGGGLTAVFNLEGHFSADTGAGVNGLFRRQANVGLKGGFGTVLLGRQYSPALLAHLGTEPRAFKEQHSLLYPYAFNQNPISPAGANDIGVFLGNAVSYSNAFGPVNVGVAYAFGEQAGNNSAGRTMSVGGSYTGPVTVSASYQEMRNNVATGDIKQYGLGAAVPLGPVTAKLLYLNTKSDLGVTTAGRTTKVDAWGAGVDWAWNSANTLTLAYYDVKDKDAADDKTKTLVLSNDLALSKRTVVYAQLAYADASVGATRLTSISASVPVAGTKSSIVGVGVKHDF